MDGGSTLAFFLLFLFLVLSGFLSGTEAAFLSHQRLRLQHLQHKGTPGAARVVRLLERPDRLLIGLLTGNNIVNVAAAAVGTALATTYIGGQKALLIATLGVTFLLLVFGEITPKVLGVRYWERVTFLMAGPVEVVLWVLSPVTRLFGRLTLWLAGGKPWGTSRAIVQVEELRSLIYLGREGGTVARQQAYILERAFQLRERRVKEVMTPRPEIIAVEQGAKLRELLDLYGRYSHSCFPIYQDNLDQVVGVLYIKDVVLALAHGSLDEDTPVTHLARPAYFVPETKTLSSLLTEMRNNRSRMVIVIDEFGGVSGLVTLKQLVEVLVGSLGDELVSEDREFEAIDERTVEVDGSLRIEEANERLGLGLPPGDYETVAGFLLARLGRIPEVGERYRHNGWHLVVSSRLGNRIERLRVIRM
ncbi:MAG: HlyC/CorC family transporter [Chloroflexi bacterium]|nr:HlyC/CorC family transporter [Chloroflexota bacterium]